MSEVCRGPRVRSKSAFRESQQLVKREKRKASSCTSQGLIAIRESQQLIKSELARN